MHNEKTSSDIMKLYEEIDTTIQHGRTYPDIPKLPKVKSEIGNFQTAVSLFMADARRFVDTHDTAKDTKLVLRDLKRSLNMVSNVINKL